LNPVLASIEALELLDLGPNPARQRAFGGSKMGVNARHP
jgi:hypothetical protein